MNFRQALLSAYLEVPCQVLPNAFWKTASQLDFLQTDYIASDHFVNRLEAWDDSRLLIYWERERNQMTAFWRNLQEFRLVLLHQDFLGAMPPGCLNRRKAYFRLEFRYCNPQPDVKNLPGFKFAPVDPSAEAQAAADLISRCYPDIQPPAEVVFSWTQHPVFDPNLWIWVIDEAKGAPAGLGIAEFDREICEGSLEWVQVLPEYRGRGIGRLIVSELLRRLGCRAKFTTVSGEVGNETRPEALYRSCGFTGEDVWWVCRAA